ncbi:MAG: hypothetical protein V3T62_06240 [Alphaproteobacteria bacterium]
MPITDIMVEKLDQLGLGFDLLDDHRYSRINQVLLQVAQLLLPFSGGRQGD